MQKYVKILCNHTRVICKSKIVIGAIIIQCTLRLLRYPNLYHWSGRDTSQLMNEIYFFFGVNLQENDFEA